MFPALLLSQFCLIKKLNQSNEKISIGKALGFGLLTGLFATLFITSFEVIITYFTKTNEFIQNLPEIELTMRQWNLGPMVDESLKLIKSTAKEIEKNGFSFIYMLIILFSGLITNSIFGMIGGALGMSLANRKSREGNPDL